MQVVMDENLKRQFKSACVLDGQNMSDVVADLISTWLQQREEKLQDIGQDTGQQDNPKRRRSIKP